MTAEAPVAASGLRKAAILLILLGEENSAGILQQMSEVEVQQVAREIARVESLTPEMTEATLQEFYQLTMGHDFAVRGGLDYARRMLNKAFGPDTGKKITDRLVMMIGGEYAHLDALQKADPQQLARFIHNEHPQTIALVLSHLNATSAAGLLYPSPRNFGPKWR